jgi:hypothetical protein
MASRNLRPWDARPEFIEAFREKTPSLLGVLAARDNRCDSTCDCGRPVGLAIITLVRDRDARADVRPDIERCLELCAVAGLTAGQMEVERVAVEIGREASARAAERLALLPPFAPAAETWARAVVLSKNWIK